MNKILLIGNSGLRHNGTDGQTVKVRLYLKKIKDEGFPVEFVDLEGFLKHPFSTLVRIEKGIKSCDRIVLITAQRGSKILIPFINKINKQYHKPFVFPLIGTSVLHYSIDKLTDQEKNEFIINYNYSLCKQNVKLKKQLSKITYILPETDLISHAFTNFYGINNVKTLNNFREIKINQNNYKENNGQFKVIFLSRVMEEKGIIDLINCIDSLNEKGKLISLCVYGKNCLDAENNKAFNKALNRENIKYCGTISNDKVIDTIREYDLFVFPTRFVGEGTPGVITESLLAGVPVLTSDFPQAKFLLRDGYDSIFFKMFDNNDLEKKLLYILDNKDKLVDMRKNALKSSEKYTYDYERKNFLKYVCGVEEDK